MPALRLHILSDLHIERDPHFRPPPVAADILVLAGDIRSGSGGLAAFAGHPTPVIYVPGNHEYYDSDYKTMRPHLRVAAAHYGVHLLDSDEWVTGGVRFLGATLWTDFRLYGEERLPTAIAHALRRVVDFRTIQIDGRPLVPQDTIAFNADALRWLGERLDAPISGPTVVVTHHAPHPLSVHTRWQDNPVNLAFVSDFSRLMGKAALWIHARFVRLRGCRDTRCLQSKGLWDREQSVPSRLGGDRVSGGFWTAARLIERLNPRLGAPEDKRMDVMRALQRVDRLHVQHVADHVVFVRNAVAAVDVAGGTCDFERLAG